METFNFIEDPFVPPVKRAHERTHSTTFEEKTRLWKRK
jgi:hypothetical protein